ncbi:VTT domain-containing protein [Patescibacteria group bacterium]|nr:VTT domain-containing protein [Patescibacteria group bacterium]
MFDLIALIKAAGYLGIFAVIFAESGLFIGFFFPGDSLLFTAGFLASQGYLQIGMVMVLVFIAAVLGDTAGYAFGYRVGPMIFRREDSVIFHKDNLLRAEAFYEKYGKKTIILARFLPAVRTFAPILAGVGKMRYRTFVSYNVIGGLLWGIGVPGLGYYLGRSVPNIDHYLLPIIGLIIVLSILPTAFQVLRDPQRRVHIWGILKRIAFKK